jgi:hypothetical protein
VPGGAGAPVETRPGRRPAQHRGGRGPGQRVSAAGARGPVRRRAHERGSPGRRRVAASVGRNRRALVGRGRRAAPRRRARAGARPHGGRPARPRAGAGGEPRPRPPAASGTGLGRDRGGVGRARARARACGGDPRSPPCGGRHARADRVVRRDGRGRDDIPARAGSRGTQLRLPLRLDPRPVLRRRGGGRRRRRAHPRRCSSRGLRPPARARAEPAAGVRRRRRHGARRAASRAARVPGRMRRGGEPRERAVPARLLRRSCCSPGRRGAAASMPRGGGRPASPPMPSRGGTGSPTPGCGSSTRPGGRTAG